MVATAALCRCICGTGKKEQLDRHRSLGSAPDFDTLNEVDLVELEGSQPQEAPVFTGRLAYSALPDQPLRGVPIREGRLWYLSAEQKVERVTFSLYINGFSFGLVGEEEVSVSLPPFTLVRNCRFQGGDAVAELSDAKIFKVSLYTQGFCYYFGVRAEDDQAAEEERSRWVLDIARAVRLVTQSLFPPFRISCDPLDTVTGTASRLMAGYLVYSDQASTASVLYVELHSHHEDHARMVLYENELCQVPVAEICITNCSGCYEKTGINCGCFCIEDAHFATRSLSERRLWLRAISNLKVKIHNQAPSPSKEDLWHYRLAIKEQLDTLRASLEQRSALDALLELQQPERPPASRDLHEEKAKPMQQWRPQKQPQPQELDPPQLTCDDVNAAIGAAKQEPSPVIREEDIDLDVEQAETPGCPEETPRSLEPQLGRRYGASPCVGES